MYRKFTCQRCHTEVNKEAGRGKLGLVKKPKRPSNWRNINQTVLCDLCCLDYDKSYSDFWNKFMSESKTRFEIKKGKGEKDGS